MSLRAKLLLVFLYICTVASNQLPGPETEYVVGDFSQEDCSNDNKKTGRSLEPGKEHREKFDVSFKSGFVIGYVFSLVSVVTIFLSYCMPWARLKERSEKKMVTITPMMTWLMARHEKNIQGTNQEISTLEKSITRMSFAALKNATACFDQHNIIGVGKMGITYKATLPHDDSFIAVKRLHDSQHLEKQFMSELMILGRFRHINILPLMGFCIESRERLLVYKYMPNGNLYDWLHPVEGQSRILDWHLRVKIATGVARGLAWIHNNNFLLAHLNINSSCILLDKNFEPKISNFEETVLISSSAKGFFVNSALGELDLVKKDVYKFGILLLELITGKDPVNSEKFSHILEETLIEQIINPWSSSSTLHYAVDKSLIGRGFSRQMFNFLRVACNCIQPFPDQRPTMLQVYKILLGNIKEMNDMASDSQMLAQQDYTLAADSSDDTIDLEITDIK